jgi:mycothiol synthase
VNLDVVPSSLPPSVAVEVTELARTAAESDGVDPLNEQTLLHLHGRHEGDQHVLARDGSGTLVGYARRGVDGSAEVVVAPAARRQGVGTALVRSLETPLRVWAHGRIDGADAFAERLGFAPVRELFRLRRDAASAPALPEKPLPAGIGVRTFRPGEDDEAWLALNARAFADHPEQGAWGSDDLAERLAQPWFDPTGFFVAYEQSTGELVGFHWTKVHEGAVGEVYIVGVDPAYQGTGLGKALTVIGVRHLLDRGLRVVELYVDGTNTAARAMYEWLGFQVAAVDVQYFVAS